MSSPVFLPAGPEAITSPIGVEFGAVYVITGPDGTRAVFNDPGDRDHVGYLIGDDAVTGLERAGVRESSDTLPEADGGVHGAFRYDRLAFTLKGQVEPDAVGAAALKQAKLLRATDAMVADGRLDWRPSTAPPVSVFFRQQLPTRITGRRPKTFIVAGVCEDPLIYSQGVHSVAGDASVIGAAGAGHVDIDAPNAGIRPSWPLLTLEGPITDPSIINLTAGYGLVLTAAGGLDLAAGEVAVIDTNPRRRSIRLADGTNRYGRRNFTLSRWPPLLSGANTIRVTGSSAGAGARLTVQWRDAWG